MFDKTAKKQREEKKRHVELIKKKKEIRSSEENDIAENDEISAGDIKHELKKEKNTCRNWIIASTVILWFIGFWMIGSIILDSSFYMFPENLFIFLQERTNEQFPYPLDIFTIIAVVILVVLLIIIINFRKIKGYLGSKTTQND